MPLACAWFEAPPVAVAGSSDRSGPARELPASTAAAGAATGKELFPSTSCEVPGDCAGSELLRTLVVVVLLEWQDQVTGRKKSKAQWPDEPVSCVVCGMMRGRSVHIVGRETGTESQRVRWLSSGAVRERDEPGEGGRQKRSQVTIVEFDFDFFAATQSNPSDLF